MSKNKKSNKVLKSTQKVVLSEEVKKKINSLVIEREELIYTKKSTETIINEASLIDQDKMAVEILTWVTKNVENFISNQTKLFKLDLILDNESEIVTDMEESKKLQDLYRAIPDYKVEEKDGLIKARKKLDKVTLSILNKMSNNEEMMTNLFKRMAYYYELKGFNKGKMLLQELQGKVSILRFEYEAFSVGVKVRNPQDNNVVKEYVIPEGFTICLEIALTPVTTPINMF